MYTCLFSYVLLGNGDDYVAVSEGLTLMAGNFPRVCVNVTIINDNADENNENFMLRLANLNSWPEFRNTSNVVILDNG